VSRQKERKVNKRRKNSGSQPMLDLLLDILLDIIGLKIL
jgi:hypothetical protein